jgi:hypothetical protein
MYIKELRTKCASSVGANEGKSFDEIGRVVVNSSDFIGGVASNLGDGKAHRRKECEVS